MGVTFTHLLLPVPRSRTPSYAAMAQAVGRLVDEGFLLGAGSPRLPHMRLDEDSILNRHASSTGCFIEFDWREARPFPCPPSAEDLAAEAGGDFQLVWPVISLEASGLRYPLTLLPEGIDPVDAYYDIEVHWGRDYIYRTSELIEPFPSQTCTACNADLLVHDRDRPGDELFGFTSYVQLHQRCPACGVDFRPEDRAALVRDPTGLNPPRPVWGGATSRFALAVECGKCWEYGAVPTEEFMAACEDALGFKLEHVLDGTF